MPAVLKLLHLASADMNGTGAKPAVLKSVHASRVKERAFFWKAYLPIENTLKERACQPC